MTTDRCRPHGIHRVNIPPSATPEQTEQEVGDWVALRKIAAAHWEPRQPPARESVRERNNPC